MLKFLGNEFMEFFGSNVTIKNHEDLQNLLKDMAKLYKIHLSQENLVAAREDIKHIKLACILYVLQIENVLNKMNYNDGKKFLEVLKAFVHDGTLVGHLNDFILKSELNINKNSAKTSVLHEIQGLKMNKKHEKIENKTHDLLSESSNASAKVTNLFEDKKKEIATTEKKSSASESIQEQEIYKLIFTYVAKNISKDYQNFSHEKNYSGLYNQVAQKKEQKFDSINLQKQNFIYKTNLDSTPNDLKLVDEHNSNKKSKDKFLHVLKETKHDVEKHLRDLYSFIAEYNNKDVDLNLQLSSNKINKGAKGALDNEQVNSDQKENSSEHNKSTFNEVKNVALGAIAKISKYGFRQSDGKGIKDENIKFVDRINDKSGKDSKSTSKHTSN